MLHIQPSTRYTSYLAWHGVGCGHAAYTRSRALSPSVCSVLASNFPWARPTLTLNLGSNVCQRVKKKEQRTGKHKNWNATHTHTQATGDWREGQKEQQGKMAMLPFGLPDPCYNLSCTQEERRIGGGELVGANNDAIAGVDIVIMWCCSLMCVVPLSCAC